jgi:hypothetical protein
LESRDEALACKNITSSVEDLVGSGTIEFTFESAPGWAAEVTTQVFPGASHTIRIGDRYAPGYFGAMLAWLAELYR